MPCSSSSSKLGLSNTESGSTEIFSFFSGQLYSFGSFVCGEGEESQGPWAAYGCSSVAKAPSTPVDTKVMAVSPLMLLGSNWGPLGMLPVGRIPVPLSESLRGWAPMQMERLSSSSSGGRLRSSHTHLALTPLRLEPSVSMPWSTRSCFGGATHGAIVDASSLKKAGPFTSTLWFMWQCLT
ncbi:hypothetical protein CRUP_012074 [Coryphaenoides rupestris]|nr:hypothetical protein CRUP_012074 [Coryphaenoides rupestris]